MSELFLELFSEEIPARMQARAADDLVRSCTEALSSLTPRTPRSSPLRWRPMCFMDCGEV